MNQPNNTITVQTSSGERTVTLHTFPAMTGFELNRRYRVDYKQASNSAERTGYALDVLAHAEVNGQRLDTEKAINAALESWKNVESVFYAVLAFNEVDLELREEKAAFFEHAGKELATTFVSEAALLIVPLLQTMDQHAEQGA
ncbi:hypothetical protein EVC45_02415 [Paraburkholderia sp. UYCP14C]|uniref:hypothetical protein n=1 Tax=Paraburkholderia sp. UYCP14C TaxID=2511130 RepID=UPI00101F0123|nr:hypothetical protein [Paraburkholderia sp. UYCP14C]RZF31326.1 hypothetical protein EVC45_02415 [Paraburkholderia sp. UYCP14C]